VSKLSELVNTVAMACRRDVLLKTLAATEWNLSHAADVLGMADASALRREIFRAGLRPEWQAAHKRGDIRTGTATKPRPAVTFEQIVDALR